MPQVGDTITALRKYLDSPEGEAFTVKYIQDRINREAISEKQLEKLHKAYNGDISSFIEKVVKKYDSDKYYNRWIKRGIEPPENLYGFILKYAEKYGNELTNEQYNIHSNMFTADIYITSGYVIQLMMGQGAAFKINKL